MESRDQGLRTAFRSTAVEIYQAPLLIKLDSMGSAIFLKCIKFVTGLFRRDPRDHSTLTILGSI